MVKPGKLSPSFFSCLDIARRMAGSVDSVWDHHRDGEGEAGYCLPLRSQAVGSLVVVGGGSVKSTVSRVVFFLIATW